MGNCHPSGSSSPTPALQMCQCRTSPKPGKVCVFFNSNQIDIINTNQESTSRSFESQHFESHCIFLVKSILLFISGLLQIQFYHQSNPTNLRLNQDPHGCSDNFCPPTLFLGRFSFSLTLCSISERRIQVSRAFPRQRWTPILWDEGRKALKSNEKLQKNFQPKDKNISTKFLQKFLTSGEEPMGRAS